MTDLQLQGEEAGAGNALDQAIELTNLHSEGYLNHYELSWALGSLATPDEISSRLPKEETN